MEPKTRHEKFLDNAAHGDSSLTPITREESFINKIAKAVSSGGSGIPTISIDPTTNICTFTTKQAEYMKSGKPFLVGDNLIKLTSFSDPSYGAMAIIAGAVVFGMFYFSTTTTGWFTRHYTSDDKVSPDEMPIITVDRYVFNEYSDAPQDMGGNDLYERYFGFDDAGNPGYYHAGLHYFDPGESVGATFFQFVIAAMTAAITDGEVFWYIPYNTDDFLGYVQLYMKSNIALRLRHTSAGSELILAFSGATKSNNVVTSATFRGELTDVDETGSPYSVTAAQVYVTFAPGVVGLRVVVKQATSAPSN